MNTLFIVTINLLGGRLIDGDDGCRFELQAVPFVLRSLAGPAGTQVIGCMQLRPTAQENLKELLAGLCLNRQLFSATGFPIWYGLDRSGETLDLHFGTGAAGLSASRLAAMLRRVAALGAPAAALA